MSRNRAPINSLDAGRSWPTSGDIRSPDWPMPGQLGWILGHGGWTASQLRPTPGQSRSTPAQCIFVRCRAFFSDTGTMLANLSPDGRIRRHTDRKQQPCFGMSSTKFGPNSMKWGPGTGNCGATFSGRGPNFAKGSPKRKNVSAISAGNATISKSEGCWQMQHARHDPWPIRRRSLEEVPPPRDTQGYTRYDVQCGCKGCYC